MKTLILLVTSLFLIENSNAALLLQCSSRHAPSIRSINLLLSNNSKTAAAAYLFFRDTPKVRLEGKYKVRMGVDQWVYGTDVNKPVGKTPIKIISAYMYGSGFSAKAELRVNPNASADALVTGKLNVKKNNIVVAKNQSIVCDVTNTLQE